VVHDFVEGFETCTEKPDYTWDADLAFADVALVVPGERAPKYIRTDLDCQRIS
jgi:protease I